MDGYAFQRFAGFYNKNSYILRKLQLMHFRCNIYCQILRVKRERTKFRNCEIRKNLMQCKLNDLSPTPARPHLLFVLIQYFCYQSGLALTSLKANQAPHQDSVGFLVKLSDRQIDEVVLADSPLGPFLGQFIPKFRFLKHREATFITRSKTNKSAAALAGDSTSQTHSPSGSVVK